MAPSDRKARSNGGSPSTNTRLCSNNMKVISFSIFKGGTGKTTSAVNTAASLVQKGKKVLLVDMDQQAQATRYVGIDPDSFPNLYEVFMGTKSPAGAVRQTKLGIDILSSHRLMAAIEEALEPGEETKLAEYLTSLKPSYDFILIDTPPHKAKLCFNGLVAADLVLLPTAAERMAVDGAMDMISYLQGVLWKEHSLYHQEIRVLFTMFRASTNQSLAVVANAQKVWRDNVLSMKIPHSTVFGLSYDKQQPVNVVDPRHPGSMAYDVLADWLIKYEASTN